MGTWSDDPERARKFSDARLAAFQRGDVNACIGMYRDDAVIVTPQGQVQGAAIAAMMTALFDEFSKPGVTFELISRSSDGDVACFTWRATTQQTQYDLCAESYVLEDGKIAVQTFTGLIHPR
jgi:ketosteroid isomerase-like protein